MKLIGHKRIVVSEFDRMRLIGVGVDTSDDEPKVD